MFYPAASRPSPERTFNHQLRHNSPPLKKYRQGRPAEERIMPIPLIWGITVAFGFLAWGIFAAQYIWPWVSKREPAEALRPLLMLHGFRYVGLAALIPGVVSPQLAATVFARGLAYGDLAAATLALIALAALKTRLAGLLVWVFNIFGTADLLNAFYQGNRISLADRPGLLGADYFIPAFGVPLLLITHFLVFRLLMRKEVSAPSLAVRRAA
jgi:hypothetical protein